MSTSTGTGSTASSKVRWAERASGPAALAAGVALLAAGALLVGQYEVGPRDLLRLAGRVQGWPAAEADATATVVLSIRLPRVVAALLVGAALAAAGTAYQAIFRNPLVSPDILGVSAGAGVGAVLGIFLSLPVLGIQLLAFAAGMGTVAVVWAVAAAVRGHEPVIVLVLAGVAVGALAGAVVSLLKMLADPYDQLPAITFWLLGSLAHATAGDVLATAPLVLLGLLPLKLRAAGLGGLLSTHAPDHAFACAADRVLLLRDGRLVADGTPEVVVTAARLGEVYGVAVEIVHVPALGRPVCAPRLA
jgi:iron complex transport system permease protein